MRQRWLIYFAIGLCFGIVDWYYLDLLATITAELGNNESLFEAVVPRLLFIITVMGLNYGIWLVPVIPVALYEVHRSKSILKAALSAVLIWVAAIFSYYATYTFLLLFVGLPNLDFMSSSNHQSATYWMDWWPPFKRMILDQFVEWIGIAVIGGAIVGVLSAYAFKFISSRRPAPGPLHNT